MNKQQPTIVITGPTASGKTAVAAALAKEIGGAILSADSRQVYKYLDVGTNKSGAWDPAIAARVTEGIPQYLTDIIDPARTFNAGAFAREASTLITSLPAAGKTPLVVGGTGLYLKALIDGLAPLPEADEAIRASLRRELESKGLDHLFEKLKAVDPESAERHQHNPQRLIRALEVYTITGTPISELHRAAVPSQGSFKQFALSWERAELNDAINRRSKEMLTSGMIEETQRVLSMGFSPQSPGLQGLGYRDVVRYLNKELSLEELENALAAGTRQYAKRQMTWFRRDERIRWIPVTSASFSPSKIANIILNML